MNLTVTTITVLLLASTVLTVRRQYKYGLSQNDCKTNPQNGVMVFQLYSLITFSRGQNPIQTDLKQPIPCIKKQQDLPTLTVSVNCPQIRYTEPDGSSTLSNGKNLSLDKGQFSQFKDVWDQHLKEEPFAIVSATSNFDKQQNDLSIVIGCVDINVLSKIEAYGMEFVEGQLEYDLKDSEAKEKATMKFNELVSGFRDSFTKHLAKASVILSLDTQSKTDLVKAVQTREQLISLIDDKGNPLELQVSGDIYKFNDNDNDLQTYSYI